MNENEHEIISAIYSFNPLDSEDEIELQKKKDEIDSKLQRYENNADTIDYAIAASSGVICGLLDSFFVGE
ncbi:MAG: hypothetical protein J5879_02635, partial [Clostridia bacterium]|nr:hypothetical protein [Clostridia bacterium]